jgi:hypothetical protein
MYLTLEINEKQLKKYLTENYHHEGIYLTIWEGDWKNDCTDEEAKEARERGVLPQRKYIMNDNPTEFKILRISSDLNLC